MIEIMAKTIWEGWPHQTVGTARRAWKDVGPNEREATWYPLAKAVRDAIRNPTDAMTEAGASVPIPMSTPNEDASVLVWQANVDAMETESAGDG